MIDQFRKISERMVKEIAKKYKITDDLAFEIFSLAILFDLPYDLVATDIWTGEDANDAGFDGVFIDEDSNSISLVQSKNIDTLKDNSLGKLRTNYTEVFANGNKDNKPLSLEMKKFLSDYVDATKRGIILNPRLYFVYNGLNSEFSNESVRKRFIQKRAGVPEIQICDLEYLYNRYLQLQNNKRKLINFTFNPVNSNIIEGQDMFSFAVGNVKAASFRIQTKQLCDLIEKEEKENGMIDFLFADNIRGYLGNNTANKGIKNTISDRDKSKYFDLLNNGLTIIADEVMLPDFIQAGIYNIVVKNPVIVNGLQTSYVLYNAYKNDSKVLDDIKIIIRLYEAKDRSIIDLITEATNTQSPISYRDKISNKEFNKYAKLFFEGENVLYITKRGGLTAVDTSKGLQDAITNQIVIKFWYATFYKKPHIAKNSVNQVMKDIFLAPDSAALSYLFSGKKNSQIYSELFIAYKIYKLVVTERLNYFKSKRKERGKLSDFLLHTDELISYGIYMELTKKGSIKKFDQKKADKFYADVVKNIKKIIGVEVKRRGEAYAHSVYFKSERCFDDYNSLIGIK